MSDRPQFDTAQPDAAPPDTAPPDASGATEVAQEFTLSQFEEWMLAVVRHPDGLDAGLVDADRVLPGTSTDLERVVCPSAQQSSRERLQVYANMYFWRLVEVLGEDHPALICALGGHHEWYHLAVAFLHAHPSRHYGLSRLGDPLPDWIREHAPELNADRREFLAELALLERIKEAVFHAPQSDTLSPSELQALPGEQWADAHLDLIPALRLLATEYPVNPYFQAVVEDQEPAIPAREPSYCVVWRQDYEVWRANLSRPQYLLLSAIDAGKSLGEALEALVVEHGFDADWLIGEVGAWFEQWTADGLFGGIRLPG